jgi:hypothetical protein
VAPKRISLQKAEDEYQKVMSGLRGKQEELAGLLEKLAELEGQLKVCVLEGLFECIECVGMI